MTKYEKLSPFERYKFNEVDFILLSYNEKTKIKILLALLEKYRSEQ